MTETGFLADKPRSPSALLLVVALHGAALTALALTKMEVVTVDLGPIKTYDVPVIAPPPPEPVPEPEPRRARRSVVETVTPRVPTPPISDNVVISLPDLPSLPADPVVGIDPPSRPNPPAPPQRVEARISPRSELQPPYPSSEQRMGREGTVTLRLLIGADGRVKSAEKVRATSDAFYRTTERHALRHWTFEPATLDGRPVESRKTMTVHFRLND